MPKNEDPFSLVLRMIKTRVVGPEIITLTLAKEPDRDFIMSYVFGE